MPLNALHRMGKNLSPHPSSEGVGGGVLSCHGVGCLILTLVCQKKILHSEDVSVGEKNFKEKDMMPKEESVALSCALANCMTVNSSDSCYNKNIWSLINYLWVPTPIPILIPNLQCDGIRRQGPQDVVSALV